MTEETRENAVCEWSETPCVPPATRERRPAGCPRTAKLPACHTGAEGRGIR